MCVCAGEANRFMSLSRTYERYLCLPTFIWFIFFTLTILMTPMRTVNQNLTCSRINYDLLSSLFLGATTLGGVSGHLSFPPPSSPIPGM